MPKLLFPVILIFLCSCKSTPDHFDPLEYVDPFIGTGAHGHTIPGAAWPYGMVQLSPDTHLDGWDASSGYHYDDSVLYGFSHTHLSGTGIGDMGDILILPFVGSPHDTLVDFPDKQSEKASPGYYTVKLKKSVVLAELTVSPRVGIHRYHYGSSGPPQIMLDLGHILQANWGHRSLAAELELIDEYTLRGYRKSSGWAHDHPVYFYIHFSRPYKLMHLSQEGKPTKLVANRAQGNQLKAFFQFAETEQKPLLIKVGISSVSVEGAEKNLKEETPHWDFDSYAKAAAAAWREKLRVIEIETADSTIKTNFYTALYHCMFAPMLFQDVDGQYRGIDKKIHQAEPGYTNYTVFSLWDTFRAWHPLMTIIDPAQSRLWMQALLRKYEEGGLLPKWPLAANYTGTMIGYPAVSVLADAIEKDLGGFDQNLAWEAAQQSTRYEPKWIETHSEPRAERLLPPHLRFVSENAPIPADQCEGSVSYGLECAYYDWCVAQIATKLGHHDLAKPLMQRGQAYQHYFDSGMGFMRGKMADGSWRSPFSPFFSDHEAGDYIEGNAWQWSWFVPHDIEGLVELMGGKQTFAEKLDALFTVSSEVQGERASADISGLIGQYAHGNEPSHHIAYLYHFIDQAWKGRERLDQIMKMLYSPTPDGISGNEDCGQMSAWYVMNALGFYQVCPGEATYAIGRPLIDRAIIRLENGKSFQIETQNNQAENPYVRSIKLNDRPLSEPFFSHQVFKDGGRLVIEMQNVPNVP